MAETSKHGRSRAAAPISIGKIVRSESHVRYTCQVFGPGEVGTPPEPADFAFGSFVRVPLRVSPARADVALLEPMIADVMRTETLPELASDALAPTPVETLGGESWAVGLIYDTILVNPAFGTLGPRLSNDEQVSLFSPDYLAERAVLVSILLLGVGIGLPERPTRVVHGIPPLAPDLGAVVSGFPDDAVRAFHFYADQGGQGRPYLHMGYLPHAIATDSPLLPMAMLRTVERLERLFPQQSALLSIVKRNFAWRLKVRSAG